MRILSVEREAKGYGVEQIAAALNIDKDEYLEKEEGLIPFNACEMFNISQLLGKKVGDIFEEREMKKTINKENSGGAMMNCLIDFVEHKINHLELVQWELDEVVKDLYLLFDDIGNEEIYKLYRKNAIYSEAIDNTLEIISRELVAYREILKGVS